MIIFDHCDHCRKIVAGKRAEITYERTDGDVNVLCLDCMRKQMDADFSKDEVRRVRRRGKKGEDE